MSIPTLKWRSSPNFNSRQGTRVDQIIIHDMEGTYAGSIEWFAKESSGVSAHFSFLRPAEPRSVQRDLSRSSEFDAASARVETG